MRYRILEKVVSLYDYPSRAVWYHGEDTKSGENILIKSWQLPNSNCALMSLWSHYVRQCQGLCLRSAAKNYLLTHFDSWSDEKGFHLAVHNNGLFQLERSVNKEIDRHKVWPNLYRLASGINILHNSGLVHCSIGLHSIFTNPHTDEVDYKLGNIDWDVWLSEKTNSHERGLIYSTTNDWRSFGKLALWLLNLNWNKVELGYSKEGLSYQEFKLLSQLREPTSKLPLDPVKQLEKISKKYSGLSKFYYLGYNAKTQKKLWEGENPKLYLLEDLSQPTLRNVLINNKYRLVLGGCKKEYILKQWGAGDNIQTIENIRELKFVGDKSQDLDPKRLKIIDLERLDARTVKDSCSWNSENTYSPILIAMQAFLSCELIWQYATCVWLVRVVKKNTKSINSIQYTVKVIQDEDQKNLNRLLCIESCEKILKSNLTGMRFKEFCGWKVRRAASREIEYDDWIADNIDVEPGELKFKFVGRRRFDVDEILELKSPEAYGSNSLIKRKLRYIEHLSDCDDLLSLIECPQPRAAMSSTPLKIKKMLDGSKRDAMEKIVNASQLFALQGPPGVGKSYLLLELVKNVFSQLNAPKIVFTAHGHTTVNQFAKSLFDDRSNLKERLLIIRSKRPISDPNDATEEIFSYNSVVNELICRIFSSQAYKTAPDFLKDELNRLSSVSEASGSLKSLLISSADILLSTTTSREVESAVDAGKIFDWLIIEEAGRASGTDLLGPLLLSPCRLLVGDTRQLPPFGERELKRMLMSEDHFRMIITNEYILDNRRRIPALNDLLLKLEMNSKIPIVENIKQVSNLFEHLVKNGERDSNLLPATAMLTEQYRMHPRIANVVSELFYDKKLKSANTTIDNFDLEQNKPFLLNGPLSQLKTPLVFVDLPWVSEKSSAEENLRPPYSNEKECEAVVKVLKCIKPASMHNSLSIAVLTPYNEQVKKIRNRLRLEKFSFNTNPEDCVYTIDSFQGNEADIVVVSLVRNNTRAYGKGLGFLSDPRRFNVLLSRAKWMLIIVGSSKFLQKRFPYGRAVDRSQPLYFLKKFSRMIRDRRIFKRLSFVAFNYKPKRSKN